MTFALKGFSIQCRSQVGRRLGGGWEEVGRMFVGGWEEVGRRLGGGW